MTIAKRSWSSVIGTLLHQAQDCQPTIETMAARLHVTPRTLNRYLAREGTTFRDLALQVRSRRARALLADGKLPVSQIAYALGYTDLANFSRSFKKACGVTPSAYRDVLKNWNRLGQLAQEHLQFY